jgi:hypothetical protein
MSLESLKKRVKDLEESLQTPASLSWPPKKEDESAFCFTLYQCLVRDGWLPPQTKPVDMLAFLLSEASKRVDWTE